MSLVKVLERDGGGFGLGRQEEALALAQRLPSLVVAARETAASVMHGLHGRRRSGPGENFWQFRPYSFGEAQNRIDWRRSARDDRIYVREREWESAHTVATWIDRSASMRFVSKLALQPKVDRAVVLGLAAADLLVGGGERVALLGLTRPLAARDVVERFGVALAEDLRQRARSGAPDEELPAREPLARNAHAVLIGDFLSPAAEIEATIRALAARGARGHLVLIADPVEETFPFAGHTEFLDVDSPARLSVGEASAFREAYLGRLAAHREAVREAVRRRGWTVTLHRTDRPASEALIALKLRLEAELAGAGRTP
ncbi:DUF58 domain-containing protein [Methylocella sp.]|uniref:DUF58 domain-containing protein n=1 Tax=Methylocella sp. TaxID=1978226 RepID=UPI0035B1647C